MSLAARRLSTAIAALLTALLALPAIAQDPPPPSGPDAPNLPPEPAPTPFEPGAVIHPSGLQYVVLTQGSGPKPRFGDWCLIHLDVKSMTGESLQSTKTPNRQPQELKLGLFPIEGINIGLELMNAGSTYKFFVPAPIGVGQRGAPPQVQPGDPIIVTVDLIRVEPLDVELPAFPTFDPEKVQELPSGLKMQIIKEGEGPAFGPSDGFVMSFACWNTKGRMVFGDKLGGEPMRGTLENLAQFEFFKLAVPYLKLGSVAIFEVPADMLFKADDRGYHLPPNSTTIWKLEMTKINRVPTFVLPPDEELTATESGLKYKVLAPGEGESPRLGQQVKVQYAGWLTDGSLFDASFARGEPATFALQPRGLIEGWIEGLQIMKPGARYIFVVPPELGYADRGSPPKIGPNATLVFLVELIEATGSPMIMPTMPPPNGAPAQPERPGVRTVPPATTRPVRE